MGVRCSNLESPKRKKSFSPKCLQAEWTVCAQVSRRQFIKKTTRKWNFDQSINYITDAATRFQPWVSAGRYLATVLTNSDYFELGAIVPLLAQTHGKFLLVIEKRHKEMLTWKTVKFPNHISFDGLDETKIGLDRPIQVIGVRDRLLVIQVCRGEQVGVFEGYIAREEQGLVEVERAISFACRCHAEDGAVVMEAIISPDHTKMLLKPSWVYLQGNNRRDLPEDCLYLLDLATDTLVTTTLTAHAGRSTVMAFDPRYAWSRVAIGNRCVPAVNAECTDSKGMLSLIDLRDQSTCLTTETNSSHHQAGGIQSMVFSPDGRFLAALTGSISLACEFHILPSAVRLHDANTLTVLKEFGNLFCGRQCHVTPAAIFPLFSQDCRQVAFLAERKRKSTVTVVSVPVKLSLSNLCRTWFRQNLPMECLFKLPITQKNKDFLLYRPIYE